MMKRMIVILMVTAGLTTVHACYDPCNVFAVKFNAGESVDCAVIATKGEEGVNYRVTASDVYTFRAHYEPSIMVSLSASGMSFAVDSSVIQLEGFAYGTCVRTELEWLVDAGILAMDRAAIEKVEAAYAGWNASGISRVGPGYWTKQDTLLHSDVLVNENGQFLEIDCAGPDAVEVDLPPQPLSAAVPILHPAKNRPLETVSGKRGLTGIAVNGRILFRNREDVRTTEQSGVVLVYNRRSNTVKKIVVLP